MYNKTPSHKLLCSKLCNLFNTTQNLLYMYGKGVKNDVHIAEFHLYLYSLHRAQPLVKRSSHKGIFGPVFGF